MGRLREDGHVVNRKRIQRLWREEGLRVPARRRERRRRGVSGAPSGLLRATRPGEVWAVDFQFDSTTDGRQFKLLHVLDEQARGALAIVIDRRIDADALLAWLE